MFDSKEADVVIVGAGPVGLFTALQLAQRGVDVQIFDRDWRTATHSYALALHPRTLDMLDEIGIAADLIPHGRKVTNIRYFDTRTPRASLDLSQLDTRFPFLLVLPQSVLEDALEERLRSLKVKVHWNHRVQGITVKEDSVSLDVARLKKESMGYPIAHTEWVVGKMLERHARFLIGADGYQSRVRDAIEVDYVQHGDPQHFVVFEYFAPAAEDDDVRIVFSDENTSVYWPLPGDLRRWSFQVPQPMRELLGIEHLCQFITDRVGWTIPNPGELRWASEVTFEPRLVERFVSGPVLLAGDAAHLTGPFGVQSMNVGLFEAHEIAWRIAQIVKAAGSTELLRDYDRGRQEEWRRLLQLDGVVTATGSADEWIKGRVDRLVPTIPSSGHHIEALLGQLGLAAPEQSTSST